MFSEGWYHLFVGALQLFCLSAWMLPLHEKSPSSFLDKLCSLQGWGKCQNSTEWHLKQALTDKAGRSGGNISELKLAQTVENNLFCCMYTHWALTWLCVFICPLNYRSACWYVRPDAEEDGVSAVIARGHASVCELGIRPSVWLS